MSVIRVVNASPLISLAKIGRHELLQIATGEVLIPDAVAAEISAGPDDDPARLLLASGFGTRLPPSPIPSSILEWGLGAGESAVIADALRRQSSEAVLDDEAARRCAKSHRIPVVGTLGIVLRAKQAGEISAAAPVFAELRNSGLYLSDGLAREVLAAADEEWTDWSG